MHIPTFAHAMLPLALASSAAAAVQIDVIVKVGDHPAGSDGGVVSTLNAPFTDGNGKVGFTGNLNPSNNFVFYDNAIIWKNSHGAPSVLTGAEGTMGVSNTGNFIYSPTDDGNDSVWTASGVLLQETDPAPDFAGMFNSFNSRPIMLPDGTAYWMAGLTTTQGGTTSNRVFYKATPAGAISKVFAGGDVISGFTLATGASNFAFWVSDNTQHHIHIVDTTAASTMNTFVLVDGALVHQEGTPTGQGANWAGFAGVSINNSGNYVFGGDDSGATGSDAFVAYNGNIVIREGSTIDGFTIAAGSSIGWVSINNLNKVAYVWNRTGFDALFVGDASDLPNTSQLHLKVTDEVDVNGDNVADAIVMDFETSATISPGLDFSDHNFVYLEVTLQDIGQKTSYEAIIRVPIPGGLVCAADIAPAGGDGQVNVQDLLSVITNWGACPNPCPPNCAADINADCNVNVVDLLAVITAWGPCP
jgi:hypothetical protein